MGKEELTGQHYGRADLIRMGIFSEPNYVSSGEPFVAKKGGIIIILFLFQIRFGRFISLTTVSSLDYRANGKQFLTAPPKRGHDSKDAYFDQHFIRLFENEPYTDLVALRRGWRIKGKEKNITTTPFKPSSVPPKPSGKGSHWGTIEQQWPIKNHKFELPPKPEKNDKKPPELKVTRMNSHLLAQNFVTSPSKKGSGYGYCNVTIGKSYEYQTDPYDGALLAERNSRAANKKKMVGEKPFVSSSTNQEFFNHFAGMSKLPLEKDVAIEKQEKKILVPFKPSSGYGYTINPYPSYELPKGALERPATVKKGMSKSLIFKPSGVTGTYPIRSIIESSCPIAPPTWAKETLRTAMKDG